MNNINPYLANETTQKQASVQAANITAK